MGVYLHKIPETALDNPPDSRVFQEIGELLPETYAHEKPLVCRTDRKTTASIPEKIHNPTFFLS